MLRTSSKTNWKCQGGLGLEYLIGVIKIKIKSVFIFCLYDIKAERQGCIYAKGAYKNRVSDGPGVVKNMIVIF